MVLPFQCVKGQHETYYNLEIVVALLRVEVNKNDVIAIQTHKNVILLQNCLQATGNLQNMT